MMNVHSTNIFGFGGIQQNITSVRDTNQFNFLMRVWASDEGRVKLAVLS